VRARLAFAGAPADLHQTTFCAQKTIDFIRAQATRRVSGTSPWFFSFNCFDPHHPFDPPPECFHKYDPADMPLPRTRNGEHETKPPYQSIDHTASRDGITNYDFAAMSDHDKQRITAAYYAMIELIDDQVGRILAALDETGQRENTLVIFMSDHGEMLGDHGFYLKGPHFYEQAIRVPLIMSWPGRIGYGQQIDGLVELIDLAPTFLDAAKIEAPGDRMRLQGRSVWPILTREADGTHLRDHVFCEYYNAWSHRGEAYATMLRTEDAKIAVYHGPDADKEVDGELYDLRADPGEFNNLWNKPSHADTMTRLLKQCFDASVFTMDPMPPRLGDY